MVFIPGSLIGGGGGEATLDVEVDIDPLHFYRPIDDATHTVLSGGNVDTLKDIGRSATALNLQQTTDSLRFTHGIDGTTGQHFMSSSDGTHKMSDVIGTVADWDFAGRMFDGDGCTVACIVKSTAASTFGVVMNTNSTLSVSGNNGFYLIVNSSAGTRGLVFNFTSSTPIQCLPTAAAAGSVPSTYVVIFRFRRLDPIVSEDLTEGEIRSNGVSIAHQTPRANPFDDTRSPTNVLQVGEADAAGNGIIGEIYELVLDDRWWSDELVRRYEKRAVNDFGADNMIL